MKKQVVAVAVFAALISGAASAATVYKEDGTKLKIGGRVEFRGDFIGNEDGEEIQGSMKDTSRARLNFDGSTEINDNLSGFAFYELEQKSGKDDTLESRYMYVGLESDFGAISFGKQDMASVQISDLTDITEFSGIQQYVDSASDKTRGVIAYRGQFDDLNVQATYATNNNKDEDQYGVSALYSLPFGLDIGAAYSAGDNGKGKGSNNEALFGLGYTINDLYLGATYSFGDNDDDADDEFTAMEFAAEYKLTKEFKVRALYAKSEDKVKGDKTDTNDFAELAGYYKFNSDISTYVAYRLNNLDSETDKDGYKIQGEDTLRLGVKYEF